MRIDYVMYVDETGNPAMKQKGLAIDPYLSLTGAIIDRVAHYSVLEPAIANSLRIPKYVSTVPGREIERVCFRRTNILSGRGTYAPLANAGVLADFTNDFEQVVRRVSVTLINVTIDKLKHLGKYSRPMEPYQYCFEALMERFHYFLAERGATGKIACEKRGFREDSALQTAYDLERTNGGSYVRASEYDTTLVMPHLTFHSKYDQMGGLEIADVLGIGAMHFTLKVHGKSHPRPPHAFDIQLEKLIKETIFRWPSGKAKGRGAKLL